MGSLDMSPSYFVHTHTHTHTTYSCWMSAEGKVSEFIIYIPMLRFGLPKAKGYE